MTAVGLHSFSRQNNHYAEITAWTMFATYAIAACEKNGHDFEKNCAEAIRTAREAIYGLLKDLCDEISARAILAEGDPFSEFAFYRPRALLIYALMSIYWMWSEAEGWKQPDHKSVVEGLIPDDVLPKSLWGEGAIPHLLTFLWYRKRIAPSSSAPDEKIATVLREILGNKLGNEGFLPSPYYDVEDVVRHQHLEILGGDDPVAGDGFEGTSYICESLLMCLVRADLKEACQELWPNFTWINHERVVPDEPWRYGLYRTGQEATNATKIYPRTMQWSDLQEIMAKREAADVPEPLKADPIVMLLFTNVFPFRASFSAMQFLHAKFGGTPIPNA